MKFVSFTRAGAPSWGALDGARIADLGPTGANIASTLRDAIAVELPATVPSGAPRLEAADLTYLPVIPNPGKIVCVGINYRAHLAETGREEPPAPTLFTRFADSQIGHEQDATYPDVSEKFDYEGELAVVIGTAAYRVSAEEAMGHVAGYAPYNDFTARDWQRATPQWTSGKNFVGTGAFGPALVTPDEVPDLGSSALVTRVNGEERQRATIDDLVFDIPALIAFVSTITVLRPGDVIVTGTPGGVGMFMEPSGLLAEGDVVEVEIDGVGLLRNTVVRGVAQPPV